ncbi:MAG TPA: hypothetical protein V6D21_06665 [Candidatus Obscuribacterales bacterium]
MNKKTEVPLMISLEKICVSKEWVTNDINAEIRPKSNVPKENKAI